LYIDINLLTNGKIKDYPAVIPMKIMKIIHYKELKNASQFDDHIFESTASSVLNNLIDWNRLDGSIKTVDDLTPSDRLKLLFFQIVNSKGGELNYTWECGDCETKNELNYNLVDVEEIKLKNNVEDIIFKSSNGIEVIITYPRNKVVIGLDNMYNNGRYFRFTFTFDLYSFYFDLKNNFTYDSIVFSIYEKRYEEEKLLKTLEVTN